MMRNRGTLGKAGRYKCAAGAFAVGRIAVRQKVSQSDLAAMAGIARENVSRIINDWTRRAVVSRIAGYYCIENRTTLEREVDS